jgi:hypothetical protein
MQVAALFIGFTKPHASAIAKAIGRAGRFAVETAVTVDLDDGADLAGRFDAVFLSAEVGPKSLGQVLAKIRQTNRELVIVLVYGAEPDGRLFHLAERHDCWLTSDEDRMKRSLTLEEVADGLAVRLEGRNLRSRLMEITSCSGPCSTGE